MRGFIQMVCAFMIAVGTGLLAFGSQLEPRLNVLDPASVARMIDSYEQRSQHMTASITTGVGTGFLLLGVLGLVLSWINNLTSARMIALGESSSRTLVAVVIWLAVALTLTFGVFRWSWSGGPAMGVLLFLVASICGFATAATAFAYGWQPWAHHASRPATTNPPLASGKPEAAVDLG